MVRMNSVNDESELPKSEFLTTLLIGQRKAVGELPEAKLLSGIQKQLAEAIILESEKAKEIEELIELEMLYQELDERLAASDTDLNSIRKARIGYLQIADTIRQMRRAPAEYMASNIAANEAQRDPRKIDRTKALEQIQGNKTRLKNRVNFASSEWRDIWKARINLADKTEKMYRALHNKLVDDYGKDLA